jgi:hypothetical protein
MHKKGRNQFRPAHCRQYSYSAQLGMLYACLHLHPANIPAQTHPRTASESEEEAVHVAVVFFHPPFRSEGLDVLAVHLLAAVEDPRVAADDGPSWDVFAGDCSTAFGCYAGQAHAYRWVEPEAVVVRLEVRVEVDGIGVGYLRLVHHSLEVRHLIRLAQLHWVAELSFFS